MTAIGAVFIKYDTFVALTFQNHPGAGITCNDDHMPSFTFANYLYIQSNVGR